MRPPSPQAPHRLPLRATAVVLASLALAITTVVVVLSEPAATAGRDVRDARHDVWAWQPSSGGQGRFARSTASSNVDLETMSVRHRRKDIVVRVGYVDLRKQGPAYGVGIDFRTDEGVRRHASFVAGAGSNWLGRTVLLDKHRHSVSCARQHTHVSYRRDGVWVTFPRTCFSKPSWVQFRAMSFRRSTAGTLLVDNPHNESPLSQRWSPRLGRG